MRKSFPQFSFRHFGKVVLAILVLTCVASLAQAQGYPPYGYPPGYYHRAYRGPYVVGVAPVVPLFVPAPVVVYQQPTTVTMTCASGQTISVTGTGSFPHLLNRANRICATRYPAAAPVIVQGAPMGTAYCREYQTTAVIGGVPQETYGTACRQPDGSWQIRK